MGKADIVTKKYMSDNKHFADAFNYYLYKGEKIIESELLYEKDTSEMMGLLSKEKKKEDWKFL